MVSSTLAEFHPRCPNILRNSLPFLQAFPIQIESTISKIAGSTTRLCHGMMHHLSSFSKTTPNCEMKTIDDLTTGIQFPSSSLWLHRLSPNSQVILQVYLMHDLVTCQWRTMIEYILSHNTAGPNKTALFSI